MNNIPSDPPFADRPVSLSSVGIEQIGKNVNDNGKQYPESDVPPRDIPEQKRHGSRYQRGPTDNGRERMGQSAVIFDIIGIALEP